MSVSPQRSFARPAHVLVPYRHPKKLKAYEGALRAAGLEPASVLTAGSVALKDVSGLLLMGGTDVNPARYGQTARPETDQPDDERDTAELELIQEALERDIPILAICRGLQILNVYHGGTLIQHLPNPEQHDPENAGPAQAAHEIRIEPETLLASIAGTGAWRVNSRHHQAIDRLGESLRISARGAGDSVIEAIERPDKRFVLGVQWHPEDQFAEYPEQLKLFERFADALAR
jgi:putative glutamine amidotransferase